MAIHHRVDCHTGPLRPHVISPAARRRPPDRPRLHGVDGQDARGHHESGQAANTAVGQMLDGTGDVHEAMIALQQADRCSS